MINVQQNEKEYVISMTIPFKKGCSLYYSYSTSYRN